MADLRIDQVNVVVPDVVAATEFLRDLGVEMPAPAGEWAAHHVTLPVVHDGFDADLDSSVFAAHWGGLPRDFAGVVVNVRTAGRDDVDSTFDRATALGAEPCRSPYDTFWGSRFAVVRGPGPISVGIMSQPDPAMRAPTPAVSEFA